MNRTAIGLAIGAGYVLGRTRKMKLAIAAGSMIAGKRLNLSPGAVAELVTRQLKDNPQFKEIGDELRKDLSGVGKAASGALVERQISALADRLHSRTADVRGRVSGVVKGGRGGEEEEAEEPSGEEEPAGEEEPDRDEDTGPEEETGADEDTGAEEETEKAPRGRRSSRGGEESGKGDGEERPSRTKKAAKAPAKKTASKASAAKKAPARKTASAAGRAARTAGGRKGGGDSR